MAGYDSRFTTETVVSLGASPALPAMYVTDRPSLPSHQDSPIRISDSTTNSQNGCGNLFPITSMPRMNLSKKLRFGATIVSSAFLSGFSDILLVPPFQIK